MSNFGDRVRIKGSPETLAAGIAGLEGDIYGMTTPSLTDVEVVGGSPNDCALNVSLSSLNETFWVRPDLVEVIDHNPGMEIVVGNMRAIRQADGSWVETKIGLWAWLRSLLKR